MQYYLPDAPQFIIKSLIDNELRFQKLQIDYCRTKVKIGDLVEPAVFQPVFEPEEGALLAVFIEPGEAHFVYRDEVHPMKSFDELYREHRRKDLGRVADIESVEVRDGVIRFIWSGCLPIVQIYEQGFHPTTTEQYVGSIYSSTWNHMMQSGPNFMVQLRGGYRKMKPVSYSGSRDDAEEYAKGVGG